VMEAARAVNVVARIVLLSCITVCIIPDSHFHASKVLT
jgi:hypothetical protein